MSKSILLSRSARFCAGRVSLSHLRDKLLRFGELDAAFRLRRFPADTAHDLNDIIRELFPDREDA